MSIGKAIELLHTSIDLSSKALDGETDPAMIEVLTFVSEQLELVIRMLEEDRPAIRLNGD